MNKSKKQFYKILSNYFNENKTEIGSIEDIKFLETAAILNICLPFFIDGAKKSGISTSPGLNKLVMQIVAQNYRNLSVQEKLINKLFENNIPCAVLKGSTVSVTYPEPLLRPLGDIDLIVSEDDYEKAIELISGNPPEDRLSLMHDFHYRTEADGVCVEIHRAVDEFEEGEELIKEFMTGALNETEAKRIEQFSFPCLKNDFQAVMLLVHTKRHYFENELNIRLLLDWAMYVSSVSSEYWNKTVYPLLERLSLDKWADSLSSVCEDFLRLGLKDKLCNKYGGDIPERLADEFISDKLRKNKINSGEEEKKSLLNVFSVMNDTAARDFKATGKCKLLLPFFWVIIAVRYIYRRKIGFRGKIEFAEFSTAYKKKDKLLEEIKGEGKQ